MTSFVPFYSRSLIVLTFLSLLFVSTKAQAGLGITQQEDNTKPNFLRATNVDRDLLASCDSEATSKCFAAGLAGELVVKECGAFASEKDGAFCNHLGGKVCCGHPTKDCCDINGGAIIGALIAFLVVSALVLALSIYGCCYCCTCCCLNEKLHGNSDNEESKPEATDTNTTGGLTPPKEEASAY